MPHLIFTRHLSDVVPRTVPAEGQTVGEALDDVLARYPRLRSYVLDDQGRLRTHVRIFVDDAEMDTFEDPVAPSSEVYVLQALSGG